VASRTLTQQAERVSLLLDAAPDDACPPDLEDFVTEVEKLVGMILAPQPVAPTRSFAFKLEPEGEPESSS